MRLLVLGCEGMLGHKMLQSLSRRFPRTKGTIRGRLLDPFYRAIPLYTPVRIVEGADALDAAALRRTLEAEEPECLVNCIGIVKQRLEVYGAATAIAVNSLLPRLLADWTAIWGARLIHFSTDCVFSGSQGNHSEEDVPDAQDLYGKTKSLGEICDRSHVLTLRTSMIGRELAHSTGLLEWFLAQKGKKVRGYKNVAYSGVTTPFIAELVGRLIEEQPGLSGLFQVTAPVVSKHDLLVRIRDAYCLDVEIVPDGSVVSDRSLSGVRFRQATGYPEPSWDELIPQMAGDPTPYGLWRQALAREKEKGD